MPTTAPNAAPATHHGVLSEPRGASAAAHLFAGRVPLSGRLMAISKAEE